MKGHVSKTHLSLLSSLLLLIIFAVGSRGPENSLPRDAPNILVFIADDAGGRGFNIYGNEAVRTPNIDRLVETGLLVQPAFLTIAQCSPSRISILTGMYPHATGAEDLHMPLPEDEEILPTYLQRQGYFTGHMGKMHLGPHGAEQFQWYDPAEDHNFSAFTDFLKARQEGQPFFLWVAFHDSHRIYGDAPVVHDPSEMFVPPFLAETPATRRDIARYYDEVARMDRNIGQMLAELERRGLRDSTLVIFLSDNGAPFPRAKGTVYDPGIHTPLIFSWPAQIEAGQVYDDGLVSVVDLAPTLLELAGMEPPEEMQGRSIRELLEDPASFEGRKYIFSERNWHDCDEHIRSVRTMRYKLILTEDYTELPLCTPADVASSPSWFSLKDLQDKDELTYVQSRLFETPRAAVELYDLKKDPWEIYNVADEAVYRDEVRRLSKVLAAWEERTGDFPPTVRKRGDHTDRVTGARFRWYIPPMRSDLK